LSPKPTSVNRELEARPGTSGWNRYTTNLTTASSEFVIDATNNVAHRESFRMSKHSLQARP
jgi:hypothetical protein